MKAANCGKRSERIAAHDEYPTSGSMIVAHEGK
jgi:hypothetical protein